MSEETAQHWYNQTEILIDAARVIESSFPSVGITLSGSELEILRNVVSYATRRKTFVDAYHANYYLVANDVDWLAIETIVAILEGKLMGNENVPWGYYDVLAERVDETTESAGNHVKNWPVVPAGEVWIVHGVSHWCDKPAGSLGMFHVDGSTELSIVTNQAWTVNKYHAPGIAPITLSDGQRLRFIWYNAEDEQRMITGIWGYKMKVPE